MSHFRLGRQRGFTLVELIACIVILGILSAVAVPNLFDNQTFVTRGYADEVASSLRYAQRIAIASGCTVRVTVSAAGYSGWQHPTLASCNSGGAWTRPVLRADGTTLSRATPAGVNVNANVVVEFLSSGRLAGGSTALTIGSFTINVEAATGRVSMQ